VTKDIGALRDDSGEGFPKTRRKIMSDIKGNKRSEGGLIYTLDAFREGISFSSRADHHHGAALQIEKEVFPLRSKYSLRKGDPVRQLECELIKMSQLGLLSRSTILFGDTVDPFHPFDGKFDTSMRLLELFKRYTPGMLYLQTRSPLVVIALPVFQHLGEACAVNIGIETHLERACSHYTPGLPRVRERVKTVRALQRFGVSTNIQVSPLLPYGQWRSSAMEFAEFLCEFNGSLSIRSLNDGTPEGAQRLRHTPLAKKLAHERKFHWLRPDAAFPLTEAIELLAPEKLVVDKLPRTTPKQLEMFAA